MDNLLSVPAQTPTPAQSPPRTLVRIHRAVNRNECVLLKPCDHRVNAQSIQALCTLANSLNNTPLCPLCNMAIEKYVKTPALPPPPAGLPPALPPPPASPPPVALLPTPIETAVEKLYRQFPFPKPVGQFKCTDIWHEMTLEGRPFRMARMESTNPGALLVLAGFWGYTDGSTGITLNCATNSTGTFKAYLAHFGFAPWKGDATLSLKEEADLFFAESPAQIEFAIRILEENVLPEEIQEVLFCIKRCITEKKTWFVVEEQMQQMRLIKQVNETKT